MDDSLVDIDEALMSDSFSAPTDESFEDVNAIVQQWKLSSASDCSSTAAANSNAEAADKYLNTRTFTRPKRRVYPKCTPHLFATPTAPAPTASAYASAHTPINLKIGGLVSSSNGTSAATSAATPFNAMQRSFLGDVSPPSSMCSTSFTSSARSGADPPMPMAGSLITSNDFTGMGDFMLSSVAAAATTAGRDQCFTELFETSRPQVFDDISMLNAAYETKADAEGQEVEELETTTHENGATLTAAADDTFERLKIRAFADDDTTGPSSSTATATANDATQLHQHSTLSSSSAKAAAAASSNVMDATYEQDTSVNRTLIVMDARQPLNVTVDAVPSVLNTTAAVGLADVHEEESLTAANGTVTVGCGDAAEEGEEEAAAAAGDVWGRTLNDTFQLEQIQLEQADNTFDMMVSGGGGGGGGSLQPNQTMGNLAPAERDYGLQSTPNKLATDAAFAAHHTPSAPPPMLNDSTLYISPIAAHTAPHPNPTLLTSTVNSKFHTYVRPKVRPSLDAVAFLRNTDPATTTAAAAAMATATDDDVDVDDDVLNDLPSPPADFELRTNAQRDRDERQSLQNFEEFEKSLSLCKNDTDFDAMLNGLSEKHGAQQRSNHSADAAAQMRQSLDNIKKRHSLLNLEKQLEDQQHRRTAAAAAEAAQQSEVAANDSNRMLSSSGFLATANRSAHLQMSSSQSSTASSGGGERLLRRSRIIDDVAAVHQQMDRSGGSSSSQTSSTMSDSKENVQHNFDSNRQAAGADLTQAALPAAASAVSGVDGQQLTGSAAAGQKIEQLKPRSIPNHRDRFKTMRIGKRPTDLAVPHIADDDDDDDGGRKSGGAGDSQPQSLAADNRDQQPMAMVPRRRALQRPSAAMGSGLLAMRRDASLTITRNMAQPQSHLQLQGGGGLSAAAKEMRSPMGAKAKSIGHLEEHRSAAEAMMEKSADETNARSQKEQQRSADPVFKHPSTALPSGQHQQSSLRPPQQRTSIARPSGMMRPSSGLYSFGLRRQQHNGGSQASASNTQHTDSDTESGRMSPTNSLSSASSKGSLYRLEGLDAASSVHSSTDDVPAQAAVHAAAAAAATKTIVVPQPTTTNTMTNTTTAAAPPKRSGIQPPTASGAFAARKRSGLPRPMSMAANR